VEPLPARTDLTTSSTFMRTGPRDRP
jgi:hypothetical protein